MSTHKSTLASKNDVDTLWKVVRALIGAERKEHEAINRRFEALRVKIYKEKKKQCVDTGHIPRILEDSVPSERTVVSTDLSEDQQAAQQADLQARYIKYLRERGHKHIQEVKTWHTTTKQQEHQRDSSEQASQV